MGSTKVVLLLYSLLFSIFPSFNTLENITQGQSIKDDETLISAAGTFELGFFSLDNSHSRYLGIWYKNIASRAYVWVANGDTPLANSSGVLQFTDGGILVILDSTGAAVWSSNVSTSAKNPVVVLLDSGNLIVKDTDNPDSLLWQSFDHPGDTFLPGMELRSNMVTGQYETSLTSWRNAGDPASGDFLIYIDTRGYPQLVTTKRGTLLTRAGPWNGYLFTGYTWKRLLQLFNCSLDLSSKEVSYQCIPLDPSMLTRLVLDQSGQLRRFMWSDRTQNWEVLTAGPADLCEYYDACGANSNCNVNNSPICECLEGFIPKFPEKWDSNNWVDGCVRRKNLSCNNRDGFKKYEGIKLPDTSFSWYNMTMSLEECKTFCLKNCSCTAYANLDIRNGGSGCLLWFGNIVDTRKQVTEGQDIYIRLAASELDHGWSRKKLAGVLAAIFTFITIMILVLAIYLRRKNLKNQVTLNPSATISGKKKIINWKEQTVKDEKEDIDLPILDLSTMADATDQFLDDNIIGRGGFGPVYKGVLPNGQEIAIKRLSKNSIQGPEEFKNEALLIANLQHRNLVKLVGCCIQDDERMLIYEFMPNKSLNYYIFDQTKNRLLDWNKRFQIIGGIARGLLYLHQDSRLRIIHRDLKTSNILLDNNMNPKISDFGLARMIRGDQLQASTRRVVGTYGYMPPEYAVYGSFSVKSDVFSFGVVILEIISGIRNREFYDPYHNLNLLGHAWKLWNEEQALELIDESLGNSTIPAEVVRCIHIGLLCVQERPEDRPDMCSVVLMLNGEKPLPKPREPGFYPHEDCSSSGICDCELLSTNDSITRVEAR